MMLFSIVTRFLSSNILFFILGVDESGECAMISHRFVVDLTPPIKGKLTTGSLYDMVSHICLNNLFHLWTWRNTKHLFCFFSQVNVVKKNTRQENEENHDMFV